MEIRTVQKIFFVIVLSLIIALAAYIISPFVISLISSAIIAFLFYPLHKWLRNKVGKTTSALIISLLIIILLLIPLFFVIKSLFFSIQKVVALGTLLDGAAYKAACEGKEGRICETIMQTIHFTETPIIQLYIKASADRVSKFFFDSILGFLVSLPSIVLNFFIAFFTLFFLFRDGDKLMYYIHEIIPLRKEHKNRLIGDMGEVTHAIIYGHFVVALIQGLVAGIGYFFLGFKPVILLTIFTILAALIPTLGPPLIWLPLALLRLVDGVVYANDTYIFNAVILIVYGLLVVGTIDNVLRPKFIGDRSNLHPVLVLLGVLGGLASIGFVGIFIGPIILALLITMLELLNNDGLQPEKSTRTDKS